MTWTIVYKNTKNTEYKGLACFVTKLEKDAVDEYLRIKHKYHYVDEDIEPMVLFDGLYDSIRHQDFINKVQVRWIKMSYEYNTYLTIAKKYGLRHEVLYSA